MYMYNIIYLQFSWSVKLKSGTASLKIVSEYDQEIPQSQTADKLMAPRGRATQQSRVSKMTN